MIERIVNYIRWHIFGPRGKDIEYSLLSVLAEGLEKVKSDDDFNQ